MSDAAWLTIKQRDFVGNDPATSNNLFDVDVHINVAQIASLKDEPVWQDGTMSFGKCTIITLSNGKTYTVHEGITYLKARMAGVQ